MYNIGERYFLEMKSQTWRCSKSGLSYPNSSWEGSAEGFGQDSPAQWPNDVAVIDVSGRLKLKIEITIIG